jgi:hypothetical protein
MQNTRASRTWNPFDMCLSARLFARLFACLFALGGCSPSCSCEGMDEGGAKAPAATAAKSPNEMQKVPPAAENEAAKQAATSASSAATLEAQRNAVPATELKAVFPDAASDGEERIEEQQRLQALKPLLEAKKVTKADSLSTREALLPLLADKVGGYRADAAPMDGPTEAGDDSVRVVSRMYKKGDTQLYVKVTDTFEAAFMRAPVLDRLTLQSSGHDGYLHGRFIDGYPAIAQYYPDAKNSQVSALVGARYLVEIRMAPAASAYEAQEILKSLPLRRLAPPDQAPAAKKSK